RRDDPKKPLTLLHLIRLFKATRCSGKEISSLIELLTACISYAEPGAVDMKPYLIEPDHFEPVWRLYFDPLIIESVKCADSAIEKAACGQTVYSASRSITVKWSDGREDFYDDGNVEARERVDDLVHMALSVCVRKEQLMKLLESIQLCLSKADHVIPAWIRLYRHLTTLTLFDDDMSRILFDQFFTVDMYSPSQIVEFINELFEIWPKINDQNIVESVSINIAKLIENIIAFKTNESSTLVEQLIERICASTPAQNVRGHLCFYFLLHDTLALCNSKDLTSALKKVDLPILIWYADYVFLKTGNTDQHRRYLLSILKNVSMFSQHDLLYHWIERTASSCVSEETIGFELIESSICPTSTLPMYVLHSSTDRIDQLLTCVKSPCAIKYINTFLLIIEGLARSSQAQKYLFRTNFYLTLQSWLDQLSSSDTDPIQSTTSIVRIVHLLLDMASSKSFMHVDDIVRFFLNNYMKKILGINFENNSPLARIILFLHSHSDVSFSMDITNIFTLLFQSLKGEAFVVTSATSHFVCLSKEIVKPSSYHIFTTLFTPFVPQLMGLLGHTGSLKLAATIILAELLDLSPNEREILSLNATSTSDMNSNVEAGINDSKTQQHAFFSTEIKNKQNYVQVRKEDFVKAEKLLDELKKSAANKLDNHLRTYLPEVQPDSNILTSTEDENQDRLTLTETALENVSKVMEVINDPVPILLEGSTGVGKSASIMEAAYLCGRRELVRYNMSSRVSIADLLGKVALVVDLDTQ
ncbi:unnamed protein product, partial [Rotaria sp. Silwood1]